MYCQRKPDIQSVKKLIIIQVFLIEYIFNDPERNSGGRYGVA